MPIAGRLRPHTALGLGISNGPFPGLARVVNTLADEHGPSGIWINSLLPAATDR